MAAGAGVAPPGPSFQTTLASPGESSGAPGKKMLGVCLPPRRIGLESRFFFFNLLSVQGPLESGAPWPGQSWIPQSWEESKRQGVGGQESTLNDEGDYFSRDPDWEAWRVESGTCAHCQQAETRLRTWWGGRCPRCACPFGVGERGMLHFSAGQ